MAVARPIETGHTIAELVLHCAAWEQWVAKKVKGEEPTLSDEENFPAIPTLTTGSWNTALDKLTESNATLRAAVATIDENKLDDVVTKGGWSLHALVMGVTQHHSYHAGQIMLLKKMLKK